MAPPQPIFAYWGLAEPQLDENGKYKIAGEKAVISTTIQLDEIDVEKGFLIVL